MECECDLNRCKVVRRKLFGVAAAVLFVLGSAACSSDGDDGTVVVASDGTEDSLPETATTTTASPSEKPEDTKVPTTTVGLVDEKAGLELIVYDFLAGMWAKDGPRVSHVYIDEQKLASEDPATKLRGEFERSVFIELGKNSQTNDPYWVRLYGTALNSSITCFVEALGRIVTADVLAELAVFTAEQYQEVFDELGWDEQQVIAVENRCWSEALEFWSLGEGEGERLLDLQRKYYIDIAREWASANPDLVVPLPG